MERDLASGRQAFVARMPGQYDRQKPAGAVAHHRELGRIGVEVALQHLGHVGILVNAAGVTGPTGLFHTIDDDAWLSALQTDFMGAVRVVRAFIPGMIERKSGHIVLFGSEDAEQPTLGLQRGGHADEAAAAVVFLCSKQASLITGLNMRVDGGSVATV